MVRLVERAKAQLGDRREGRRYYLVVPGLLGGAYSIENIRTIGLSELIRLSGDVTKQIEHLPHGSKVEIRTVD